MNTGEEQLSPRARVTSDPFAASRVLLVLTTVVMSVVAAVIFLALWTQVGTYGRVIPSLLNSPNSDAPALIAAARSLDAAVVKTCSLFVAFLLIFLGGAYTLRVGEAAYKLSIGGDVGKGVLQTASPGLVIVTLGALIVSITIMKEQTINLSVNPTATTGAPVASNDGTSMSTSTAVDASGRRQQDDLDVRTLTRVIAFLAANPHYS